MSKPWPKVKPAELTCSQAVPCDKCVGEAWLWGLFESNPVALAGVMGDFGRLSTQTERANYLAAAMTGSAMTAVIQ